MSQSLESDVKLTGSDSLIFKRTAALPTISSWFTIAFDGNTTLSIHQGPKDLCDQLVAIFSSKSWATESAILDDRLEIRLNAQYWFPIGENTVKTRLILLTIMETLERSNCKLYASLLSASHAAGNPDQLVCVQNEVPASKPEQHLLEI